MRRAVPTALAALVAMLAFASSAPAATLAPIGEFASPVHVISEPGDAGRLYVVEQEGRIQLVTANGKTEFVDLTDEVLDGGERGLLSVAFPPDFATSRLLYVFYTVAGGSLRIAELTSSGNTADPATLRPVLTVPHTDAPNHNGGQIAFGPDGYLYMGTGDGGGGGDPWENGQDIEELLGKLLRIDPRQSGTAPYSVPADNPFVGVRGADEVWSYGLRNPFRFSFDRLTGDLVIGDVGQGEWEEVDFAPRSGGGGRGVNWGWDCLEGTHVYEAEGCEGVSSAPPVLQYHHDGGACSITGGYVVRDPGLTELYGRYIYGDYCVGEIRSALLGLPAASGDRSEGLNVGLLSSFGQDACGRVYVVAIGGTVSRLEDGTPTDCTPVLPPPPPPSEGRCGPVVRGGDGDDELRGGPGGQDLLGLRGSDSLRGEGGDDCVEGGAGKDEIRGGDGRDDLDGGDGGDTINSRDGIRETVACGDGNDRVRADRDDRLRGCERVRTRR